MFALTFTDCIQWLRSADLLYDLFNIQLFIQYL